MPFELEALVGHLYIVGGRAISTAPPGALVEVAPKKAARGRETDTFFALVLPSGDALAPTAFYEQMAQLAAERYFASSGSITAGLREVFNHINHNLVEHNLSGKRPYEANMICAVLRGMDLIVGRVGSAVTLMLDKGRLVSSPEDLTHDESLYTEPLGIHPVPNVRMAQYRVTNGTRVIFGDANLAELDREAMLNTLMLADIGTVLVAFKELARLQLTILAVEFVPPDAPSPHPVPAGESTTEITERARAEAAKVRKTDEMLAAGQRPPREERRVEATQEIQRRAKHGIGVAALKLASGFGLLNKLLDHFFGSAPEQGKKGWLSSPVGASSVILLPLVVAVLVVILWISRTGESEYELCIVEAQSRGNLARSLVNNERQTQIDAWQQALAKVAECEALRPGSTTMAEIRREGQQVMDGLNGVTRLQTHVIESIPQATLTGVVIQGRTLYVLDSANGLVYQILLSDTGLERTGLATALPVRRGGTVDPGFQIGEIVDITYNFEQNANVLVVLDRNGVLVECSQRFNQCSAQRLVEWERWGNPVAITMYQSRIYILDNAAGRGQIWRYDKVAGTYSDAPVEYFGGPESSRPALGTAIDLQISSSGHVYVLFADGSVSKWVAAQPLDYGLAGVPTGPIDNAVSMYLDDSVISQRLYLVSRANRTIYSTTLAGSWVASYQVVNEADFDLLSAVTVVPSATGSELLYAVSGNTVFVIEKG